MKLIQIAALFAGAACAVAEDGRRDLEGTTTVVAVVTSTLTYTTLCLDPKDCPAGATVVVTSTTVLSSTTTICSTSEAVPTSSGAIISSALPTAPVSKFPDFSISIIPGTTIESFVTASSEPASSSGYPSFTSSPPPSSGFYSAPPSPSASEPAANSTIKITSYLTHTLTSVITRPHSSSKNNHTNTHTEATMTSWLPSGTVYPTASGTGYPSRSANGTVISPKPTYSEIPTNSGHVVGAGTSSLVAFVVALAFAFFT